MCREVELEPATSGFNMLVLYQLSYLPLTFVLCWQSPYVVNIFVQGASVKRFNL